MIYGLCGHTKCLALVRCLLEAPLRPSDNFMVLTEDRLLLQEDVMGTGAMGRSGARIAVWMANDPGLVWPS